MHAVDDFANVANTGARGGVHFHDIDVAAFHDRRAMFAFAARVGRWSALAILANAIHALGDNPSRRGFAGAANACHNKGLGNAIGVKGVFQRAHHCVLANKVSKGLGAVFPGENLIAGALGAVVAHALPLDSLLGPS